AVNRCRTWLTKRGRQPETIDYVQEIVADPAPGDATELAAEIQAAVAELRPDYRAAFVLFHERGQPYDDIAVALDRPVGTIKTWLHRARMEVLERLRRRGMVESESDFRS